MVKKLFDPQLGIGQEISNADIVDIFKCGNMGGMRRSKLTNTLVLISDYTKGIYHDKWIGGVLHYTGMGKSGDQDINWAQNLTLAESEKNDIDIHLFEVMDPGKYVYCGRIELVDKPYTEKQPGEDGRNRIVWMFPIRPVPDNNVKKPRMFVFSDMEDYNLRGKNVDFEYAKLLEEMKKKKAKTVETIAPVPVEEKKPELIPPADILGKKIKHRKFGEGIITGINGTSMVVIFDKDGEKRMQYDSCITKGLIDFIL